MRPCLASGATSSRTACTACCSCQREGAPLAWHAEDEAEAYAKSGRWTKFASPILVPRSLFLRVRRSLRRATDGDLCRRRRCWTPPTDCHVRTRTTMSTCSGDGWQVTRIRFRPPAVQPRRSSSCWTIGRGTAEAIRCHVSPGPRSGVSEADCRLCTLRRQVAYACAGKPTCDTRRFRTPIKYGERLSPSRIASFPT